MGQSNNSFLCFRGEWYPCLIDNYSRFMVLIMYKADIVSAS